MLSRCGAIGYRSRVQSSTRPSVSPYRVFRIFPHIFHVHFSQCQNLVVRGFQRLPNLTFKKTSGHLKTRGLANVAPRPVASSFLTRLVLWVRYVALFLHSKSPLKSWTRPYYDRLIVSNFRIWRHIIIEYVVIKIITCGKTWFDGQAT